MGHFLCWYSSKDHLVRATQKGEEISEKTDGRRRYTEKGTFHFDRFFNKSKIGVSITKKIINNHEMIFQRSRQKKFQLEL
jgi:hypothetical protein